MIAYLNGRKIKGVEFNESGGLDFSVIGYDEAPDYLAAELNYSKDIYDNWDASVEKPLTFTQYKKDIVFLPKLPLEKLEKPTYIDCRECTKLQYVPNNLKDNIYLGEQSFINCSKLQELDASEWSESTTLRWCFNNCSEIKKIILPNKQQTLTFIEALYYTFAGCKSVTEISNLDKLDTSICTSLEKTFDNCQVLPSLNISNWNTSNVKSLYYTFSYCSGLTSLDLSGWDTSKVTNMGYMFQYCTNLKSVLGKINVIAVSSTTNLTIFGYSDLNNLRQLTMENLGAKQNITQISAFSRGKNWGVNSDEIPNAKQSLIDTLITYSFDRASAGYSTCTITLSANTKAVLSEDEIAEITAKGFSIA